MVKQNAGLWAALVIFLFGAVFFWMSLSFDYYGETGPGPGLLPLWLSGILIILALVCAADSLRNVVRFKDILPGAKGFINIIAIAGAFVLFLLTVNYVGFIASGTMFLLILLFREYKWHMALGISIFLSVLLYWVFGELLGVPLPVNAWGW
ncbi:tripartite tricarboxylate transporter TctB family protein [Paenibacillus xerothermodurans]|nr:tripartite tricarboxylate transporter TctB family protein [Paenibacillus xerothermodurans]